MGTVAPIAPDDALRPGVLLVGRYRLVELIERHDVAEVWEAHDEVLTRAVAVKALHPQLTTDEAVRERFRRDGVAAARLTHPNVAATFDTGTDDGVTFLVMELVRGRSLRALLGERGHLPAAEAVAIASQVARGLDHALRAGLAHDGVGLASVLLCDDGTWPGRVKVSGFGVPQVDGGGPGTARREVAAVGAVLYELLTGEPPDRSAPPRLRRRRPGIPKGVEAVVARSLDPEGPGFASPAALAEALEAIELGDDAEPMVRREPTPPGGVPVLARQAKRSVVPLVLFVLAAAIGVAVAAMFLQTDGAGDGTPTAAGGPLPVVAVSSFDPLGDGEEHDEETGHAIDGRPETEWRSETYEQAAFGDKDGVGLVLRLDRPRRLAALRVTCRNTGWAAEIYLAAAPGTRLTDWGEPVDRVEGTDGDHTFDLGDREAGAVLVWITDPGRGNRARIAELLVTGA